MTDVKQAGFERKVIGIPLEKGITKDASGFVLVRGFFTSDNRDEVGDIITRSATERALPKYRQWGNIRRMHAPDPVGRVLRIGVEDGLAWNEVEILVIDPKAAFEVENRLLKALSVGILFGMGDCDFLEDGGLVINDYMLAEISLVDHPANYDASLNLKLDSGERLIARQLGIHAFLETTRKLKENMPMEPVTATPAVQAESETPVEPVAPAEVVENAVSAEVVAAIVAPVEPVAEEVPAVEPVVEETPEVVEVAASVDAEPVVVDPNQKSLDALTAVALSLTQAVATLAEMVRGMAHVEAAVPAQQVVAEADAASIPQVPETVVEPVADAGPAANRKGAVVPEAQPVVEKVVPVSEEDAPVVAKPKSLREAVGLFVNSKGQ